MSQREELPLSFVFRYHWQAPRAAACASSLIEVGGKGKEEGKT